MLSLLLGRAKCRRGISLLYGRAKSGLVAGRRAGERLRRRRVGRDFLGSEMLFLISFITFDQFIGFSPRSKCWKALPMLYPMKIENIGIDVRITNL